MKQKLTVTTVLSPALYPFYKTENSVAVIVDIFRATTSICTAFENGAKFVKTVANIDDAVDLKNKGFLVAVEQNTLKPEFADFGNSPLEFTRDKVYNKTIVFTTTNGTKAVETAKDSDEILIGAFSNLSKVVDYCSSISKNIKIICAGWKMQLGMEDIAFAGLLTESLINTGKFEAIGDADQIALQVWQAAKNDLKGFLQASEHFNRLIQNKQNESIDYCLQIDTCNSLPIYSAEYKSFISL